MPWYLGLDASTQSLSAMVLDTDRECVVAESTVSFGNDLPEYNCPRGFLPDEDPLVKHADPVMWAAALDLLFTRLNRQKAPLKNIAAISGSGQQHGTVYLRKPVPHAPPRDATLATLVRDLLSRPTAPIWMDSSTTPECREINAALGGADAVRTRTGSAAIERFSGPQIRRYAKTDPDGFRQTRMIHLVSSFMCSLLIGADAPIDRGDGAGMNLLNLNTANWDPDLLAATAPTLSEKLPRVVPCNRIAGRLSAYFVERYGFAENTPVAVWSGDNPNSLIGVGGWQPGTAVISLGTSDTYFAAMPKPHVDPRGYGHVFGNPAGGFMSLICFKNGSLAREAVKKTFDLTWHQFDVEAFARTPPGNSGNLMLPYFVPEITPRILRPGVLLHGAETFRRKQDPDAAVRAIVESQALSMRLHAAWIGPTPDVIRLTGGASRSEGICRVIADVFQAAVERLQVGNSAVLGAAMRAANAVDNLPWETLTETFCQCPPEQRVTPKKDHAAVYDDLLHTYENLEKTNLRAARSVRE